MAATTVTSAPTRASAAATSAAVPDTRACETQTTSREAPGVVDDAISFVLASCTFGSGTEDGKFRTTNNHKCKSDKICPS